MKSDIRSDLSSDRSRSQTAPAGASPFKHRAAVSTLPCHNEGPWWSQCPGTCRIGSQVRDAAYRVRPEERPSPAHRASLPAVHIDQGFIHEVFQGVVGAICLGHKPCLTTTFSFETGATCVWHPDLNGAQASGPQRIAALLGTLGSRGWHGIPFCHM